MSLSWRRRKARLSSLLKSASDEDVEGIALDRLMHGQNVIGKTSKTVEIDSLRFNDRDLEVVGTLEYGQFGVIDVVTCRLNNCVYVRKSVEKKFALRTRDQCSPQLERELLLQALKTRSPWSPHLLCAFQTPTHLSIVMDYAEGGSLWDVLESSPHDGRIPESDLMWWMPQVVSAIHWCHEQGFAHRDIKPHNFVLTRDAHALLIDFGSAAPLLPPGEDGSQQLPKCYCLLPCGTCDYISPEILQAHEEALVALEMEDETDFHPGKSQEIGVYGLETDWWSLGAMVYEMAYGVAPFFASDIRSTYLRIMNHEMSLRFDKNIPVSHELQHFLRRLLTPAKKRLGRRNVMEITDHPVFEGVDWISLPSRDPPEGLHLPHFIYSEPKPPKGPAASLPVQSDETNSQGFAFSALFQSSSISRELSIFHTSPATGSQNLRSSFLSAAVPSFIGFSWGPSVDAFPEDVSTVDVPNTSPKLDVHSTPGPLFRSPGYYPRTPLTGKSLSVPSNLVPGGALLPLNPGGYSTPLKPYAISPHATLPRTSTVLRTAQRRSVSDREAMRQLVDCVGMSARKKVMESGRKPKILGIFSGIGKGGTMKELRFNELAMPIPGPNYSTASLAKEGSTSRSQTNTISQSFANAIPNTSRTNNLSDIYHNSIEVPNTYINENVSSSAETTDSEGGPPSPSPSPRPSSAMSTRSMTMLSRRSVTPTVSGYSAVALKRARSGSGSISSAVLPSLEDRSVTGTTTMFTGITTDGGLRSMPPAAVASDADFKLGPPPELWREDDHLSSQLANARVSPRPSPSRPLEVHNPTATKTCDDWFDELEQRHRTLIWNIQQLETRLNEISAQCRQ